MSIRNRSHTLNWVYAVLGLAPGALAAMLSAFMLLSLDSINSEGGPVSLSMRLNHYATWSMPLIGYGSMVIAFFRSNVRTRWQRNSIAAGLIIGILAAVNGLRIYGSPIWGYLFQGHSGYGLDVSIFFCCSLIALIFVGLGLTKEIRQ